MSEVGYCSRNISYSDRPSNFEIVVPPCFLALVLLTGLTYLYVSEQYRCYRRRERWREQCDPWLTEEQVDDRVAPDAMTCLLGDKEFFGPFDIEVLDKMGSSFNRVSELARILMPAFWAMVLSAGLLLGGDSLFACIWTNQKKPSINTGLSCFLAPAGLVFALTFGFVFQMVLEKHAAVKNKITSELSLLDQLITMTTKFKWPTKQLYMAMLKAIKTELVTTSMLIQNRESSAFTNKAPPEVRVQIWAMLDLLHVASTYKEPRFNMNSAMVGYFVTYLLALNSICTDRMGAMHTKIHPMKWSFLEFLGTVSIFGVMIIAAKSYKIELAFCQLTIFAVFMLFYLLADFDNAFNGFFRVDVTLILEVVERARYLYEEAARELEDEEPAANTVKQPNPKLEKTHALRHQVTVNIGRAFVNDLLEQSRQADSGLQDLDSQIDSTEDNTSLTTVDGQTSDDMSTSGLWDPYPADRLRSACSLLRYHSKAFRNSISPAMGAGLSTFQLTPVEKVTRFYAKINRRRKARKIPHEDKSEAE